MALRQLGRTGLTVTPIGLGLAAVGRPAYINLGRDEDLGRDRSVPALEQRSRDVLSAAYDSGIRYFDAARSYGQAEAFLASWWDARGLPRDAATAGSKWGYIYTGGWRLDADVNEVKDHSVATLRRQVEESRAILGDRLRLYQMHSATLESGVLDDMDVLSELAQLRTRGLAIGLTVSGPGQAAVVRRALETRVEGVNPFQSVQATWNLMERSAGPALADAHAAGWGVIVKEALANGRLTARNAALEARLLKQVADRNGITMDAVAIAAALANEWADVVLSGAATVAQLSSNLAGLTVRLDPKQWDALTTLTQPVEQYWGIRQGLPWT